MKPVLLAALACLSLYGAPGQAAGASASAAMEAATAVPAARKSGPAFVEIVAGQDLLAKLREGGFVLYLRHGSTDNTRPDRVPLVDFNDCASQRPLTEEGRRMAQRIGVALRAARIPLGEVRVSPLCRTRDTVEAALPSFAYTPDRLLAYTANMTDAEKAPIIANTRRLLSAPVGQGANRLLIAHGPNLMDLIGYFPKEGTLVVFLPRDGAGFDYIGSIPPGLWPQLMR